MRVIVLYHQNTEQESLVKDYVAEFERFKRAKLELMSLETVQGAEYARLYDVVQYPAVIAMADDGSMQRMWQGSGMPLMDELAYYARQQDNHDDYDNTIAHRLKILQPPAIIHPA